jgi:hypothetical protein
VSLPESWDVPRHDTRPRRKTLQQTGGLRVPLDPPLGLAGAIETKDPHDVVVSSPGEGTEEAGLAPLYLPVVRTWLPSARQPPLSADKKNAARPFLIRSAAFRPALPVGTPPPGPPLGLAASERARHQDALVNFLPMKMDQKHLPPLLRQMSCWPPAHVGCATGDRKRFVAFRV